MMQRLRPLAAGLELFALTLAGLLCLAVALATLGLGFGLGIIIALPAPLVAVRFLPNLVRRRTERWTGVAIATPYAAEPASPVRQADGWYVRDKKLYKTAWWPRMADRIEWVIGDNATWRDLSWMLIAPVTGGLAGVLPVVLVAAGLALPWTGLLPVWAAVPVGAASIVVGLALAPAAVRSAARFHRRILGGPLLRSDVHDHRPDHRVRQWAGRTIGSGVQLAILLCISLLAAPLFVATVVSLLLGYGLGLIFLVPWVLGDLRFLADWRRFLAGKFAGEAIPTPYAPLRPLVARTDGLYQVGKSLYESERWARWHQRLRWLATDPATWREVAWRGLDPFVGGLLAAVPLGLVVYGVWGLILPRITQTFFASPSGPWYGHVAGNAWAAIPVGVLLAACGVALAKPALGVHGKWSRWLLGPTEHTELVHRVEALALSRADASAAAASELRRIERDLHDGAQARLVALGMSLGAVERLLDTDPVAARALLAKTRESAELALRELREVVRGIHPPVLAERGLGDAVRALALDSPLPVAVTVQLDGRLPDPIEAAAYFAVAEALGNAAKHAKARKVDLLLVVDGDVLRIVVRDDGRGGADPGKGSGLHGLARRLGIFDGTVTVSSPVGGPTELTMEIPCASSSPRTSSSSAKA